MKLTLFGVEEANRMASEIRPSLERLVQSKREFDRLQRRVEVLSLAAAGASPDNPDARELRQIVQRLNHLGEQMRKGILAIEHRGPLVKDLERGLVDFYTIAGDRLVFLCWQLGESEVAHWHTLEGGFANRQALHRSEQE